MNIDDIKKSISEMPRLDAINIILAIRANRRERKKPIPTIKKKDSKLDISSMLNSMPKDMLLELAKMLGAK